MWVRAETMPVTSGPLRDEHVIRDVKANAIVASNPARLLRYFTIPPETSNEQS